VVEAGFVVRVPQAYPVYAAGYSDHVSTIRTWLAHATPNVHAVGRNGMHRYNNQDHSMLTAMLAVDNINGAHHDLWAVNVEEEYHESGHHRPEARSDKILDGVSGSGRDVPRLIDRSVDHVTADTHGVSELLVALSQRSPSARQLFRWGFRSILDGRRRLRGLVRAASPSELLERPRSRQLSWHLYRIAFALSTIAWLRRIQFRLRDYATNSRRRVVPVDQLLVGGWNGLSARRFAEASGLLLDSSTPLVSSAQVDLLERFDVQGEDFYSNDAALRATPYFERVKIAAQLSGHHRGARSDEELTQLAREFLDRYCERPIPYRPGRTSASVTPRVRAIADSDCYEIRDGHHRLAIAVARGATEVEVTVERPRSTTAAQRLLRQMSWLDGKDRLYQPVPLPEVATWPVMRRCTDRLAMMSDFLDSVYDSPPDGERSYLDVGACYGWFVEAMRERGFDARGIERDPLARQLAGLVYGLPAERLIIGDAVDLLAEANTRYDVVSCFSVLHHFVLGRAAQSAEALMFLLDQATKDILFLDTGERHESWFKLVLPEWSPSFARQWILNNSSFANVRILGTDRDDVAPFAGKYGRTLFACTR